MPQATGTAGGATGAAGVATPGAAAGGATPGAAGAGATTRGPVAGEFTFGTAGGLGAGLELVLGTGLTPPRRGSCLVLAFKRRLGRRRPGKSGGLARFLIDLCGSVLRPSATTTQKRATRPRSTCRTVKKFSFGVVRLLNFLHCLMLKTAADIQIFGHFLLHFVVEYLKVLLTAEITQVQIFTLLVFVIPLTEINIY